jgi:hypothetical protein
VFVVVARWSSDLLVIFIIFRHLYTTVDDYIDQWNFCKKNLLLVGKVYLSFHTIQCG